MFTYMKFKYFYLDKFPLISRRGGTIAASMQQPMTVLHEQPSPIMHMPQPLQQFGI